MGSAKYTDEYRRETADYIISTVIDLSTRMMVGWSLSDRMTADIVVDSLSMAKARGCVVGNAIFHADRGAQHVSRLPAK